MYGNTGGSLRTEERWFNASPAPISLTMCPPLQWKNIHSGGARGIKLAGVYLCCFFVFFYHCSHKRYTHLRSFASAHRSLTEDEIPKAITRNVLQRLGQMIPTPQRGSVASGISRESFTSFMCSHLLSAIERLLLVCNPRTPPTGHFYPHVTALVRPPLAVTLVFF